MIGLRWLENINPLTSGLMVINHGRKYKITLNKQKKSCWFGVPRVPDVAPIHKDMFKVKVTETRQLTTSAFSQFVWGFRSWTQKLQMIFMSSKVGETHLWFPCLIDQVELPPIPHVVEYANHAVNATLRYITSEWHTNKNKPTSIRTSSSPGIRYRSQTLRRSV